MPENQENMEDHRLSIKPHAPEPSYLRQMETLLNVSKQLAAMENLADMLKTIVDIIMEETGTERGSIFLHDPVTNELYTSVSQGGFEREIRILDTRGVAGHVYKSGESVIVDDAYANEFFDPSSDELTGFKTRSILCAPIRTVKGKVIGVVQALNKIKGRFNKRDLRLLEDMGTQAAIFLQATQYVETMKKSRALEMEFLNVVSEVTSEIDLSKMIQKVMLEAARMLKADRTTLFLNDEKTNQLWSELGVGLETSQIRFPNHLGIAGAVFQTGKTINIPHAYADLRFNPRMDRETGYFTRSILCAPVVNKDGKRIGVTQALNKRGGAFNSEDEQRLKAFTAQVSIGLENAKLFNDVQNMKNYNDSILESMSSGVITVNEENTIITCNTAALAMLGKSYDQVVGEKAVEFFSGGAAWVMEKMKKALESREPDIAMDVELDMQGRILSVNMSFQPLKSGDNKSLGLMVMIDDITSEKRMKATMSRYMDPVIADKLLGAGEDILGGKSALATVLFSDIRSFTTLTEELGPQGTVALLNEYFTIMVDCIQHEGGMLDKFIGDAIMAAFGMPIPKGDDEDRAVRAAISMHRQLSLFNQDRANHGKKPVDMGVGLNTGTVVSGNIGSPKRMDYTMIGDGVNLASRLESACKQYHAK
ncbi:MAG: GAF domain-containing protein, partial [Nitrospinota bacterium]|nr:GAF domain-containing protein [Nitrospinota bacterium]